MEGTDMTKTKAGHVGIKQPHIRDNVRAAEANDHKIVGQGCAMFRCTECNVYGFMDTDLPTKFRSRCEKKGVEVTPYELRDVVTKAYAQLGESCATEIIGGKVFLYKNGREYEVREDDDGEVTIVPVWKRGKR
jgi:hypothetical protein